MKDQVTIRKAVGDYIDTKSDAMRSGKFWEVKVDGITIRRAGSLSRKALVEHIQNNFGRDLAIVEVIA